MGLPGLPAQFGSASGASRTEAELARRILEDHRNALQRRRPLDVTWERNLLWLDGEGDAQWAEIYEGTRVAIPRALDEYRVTHNLLDPICANAAAYHCTKPVHFIAESRQDNQARQQAVIDAAVLNFIMRDQHVNGTLAQAMYMAVCCGFCPVHVQWQDDAAYAPYEPLYLAPEDTQGMTMPQKGVVRIRAGNPFDTTFNSGAKRGSIEAARYGRVFPAERIRKHFNVKIEGTDRLPSASNVQRVLNKWSGLGLNQHGSATMQSGKGGEELLAVVYEEVPPGLEQDFPSGRMTIVAVPGQAEATRDGTGGRNAVHLATIPLPSARFGFVNFYSSQRHDDVHGRPWVTPLIPLQWELNDLLSDRKAMRKRMRGAPIFVSSVVDENTDWFNFNGNPIIPVDPSAGSVPARMMELPAGPLTAIQADIQETKESLYTIGGYQAASRGESEAGDPASKVMFLAQQDDKIHGPVNQEFKFSCEDLGQTVHACFATNATVGWMLANVGDEFEVLDETYIDRTKVSQTPPQFRLVSGYGATNELKDSQLFDMVQKVGADQKPLLPTDDFRRKWSDGSLFDQRSDPAYAQRFRAKYGNSLICREAEKLCQQAKIDPRAAGYNDPNVQQAGLYLASVVNTAFPTLPTDDPAAHMQALSELNQDETENPVARVCALYRYQQYQQWQQSMAIYQAQTQAATQGVLTPQSPQQGQQPQGGANSSAPQTDPVALSQEQGVQQPEDPAMEQGAV